MVILCTQYTSIWTPDSSITVLMLTYSTWFVKICCALPHRFPAWRCFTASGLPSASFFPCADWTACWKEGSLTTDPFLVQKCPQCQFWKVAAGGPCWIHHSAFLEKVEPLNKSGIFFFPATEDLCHFLNKTLKLAPGGPSHGLKRCYKQ